MQFLIGPIFKILKKLFRVKTPDKRDKEIGLGKNEFQTLGKLSFADRGWKNWVWRVEQIEQVDKWVLDKCSQRTHSTRDGRTTWNMGFHLKYGALYLKYGALYLKYGDLYLKYGALYLKYGASYLRYAALYLKYGASRWNMGLFIWNMGFYIWNMGLSIWKYGASIWQTCGSHLKYGVLHLHKVWAPVHTIKHLAYTSQKGEGSILFCNCYLGWIFSNIWIVLVQCFFCR